MGPLNRLPERLIGAMLGAMLGWGCWASAVAWLPEVDTGRWTLRAPMAPLEGADLSGGLRLDPQKLDLWGYRGASPRTEPIAEGEVRLTAHVPDDAELQVMVGASSRHAGPQAPVRKDERAEAPLAFGPTVVIDRSRDAIYGARGLQCDPMTAPAERFELTLVLGRDVAVQVDGQDRGLCRGHRQPGEVVLASGVRRVQVESFSAPGFEDDFRSFLRGPAAWLAAVLLGAACFTQGRWMLAGMPWMALPWLANRELRGTLDALRLVDVPEGAGAFLLAGTPGIAFALLAVSGGPLKRTLAVTAVAMALSIAAGSGPILAATWALWTAMCWVNRNPVGRRVALSYGLLALTLLSVEAGLRFSGADATWQRTEGYARATTEFQELLELQEYREYPSEGFPVRPPPPTNDFRIVALGGSSTGGAFQMDDLALFWPAQLSRELGTEVVNQGVGGWNTLHIRLYLESQLERLDADLFVLYVGHNDILSTSPVPYATLLEQYRTPQPTPVAWLERSRLFFGFRFAVLALRDRTPTIAVPVSDAEDNLRAIIELASPTPVVLVTEGLNPDPRPMQRYAAMQSALAAELGQHHIQAADALYAERSPDLFIDDCHLTEQGHTALARLLAKELTARGLVSDRRRSPDESRPPPAP